MKRIKLYFKMRVLTRQMKYELLSLLYLFISDKKNYLDILNELTKVPPDKIYEKLLTLFNNPTNESLDDNVS